MKRAATRFSHGTLAATRSIHSYREPQLRTTLLHVDSISSSLSSISIPDFQNRAFIPELPLHICPPREEALDTLPAIKKWFIHENPGLRCSADSSLSRNSGGKGIESSQEKLDYPIPNLTYLSQFQGTILPYEYFSPPSPSPNTTVASQSQPEFHTLHAPLQLFLHSFLLNHPHPTPSLYIAQAQLLSLPAPLQADLPVPNLIHTAGKGDIYDANLWLGIPPTYTPLHKDPNPNLFIQLASRKQVRLYKPSVGERIFREVKRRIGGVAGNGGIRGEEMFVGEERRELEDAVWGEGCEKEGVECVVAPGEALFIPRGWWHSIRSVGRGTTASVNWWFR